MNNKKEWGTPRISKIMVTRDTKSGQNKLKPEDNSASHSNAQPQYNYTD